jgi:hypothetical protein
MSEHQLDAPQSGKPDGTAAVIESRKLETTRHGNAAPAASDLSTLAPIDREQFARDIAEIERATAALRKGEPALESWTRSPAAATAKPPRPLWLLIGVLWLSTALVAAGAVVAIATLVG